MALNPVTGIKSMTDAVKSLKKELDGVYSTIKQLSPLTASTLKDVTRVISAGGHLGNGRGNAVFNTNDSNIPTASRSRSRTNFLADGMPVSDAQRYTRSDARASMAFTSAKIDLAANAAKASIAVPAGLYAAMPDTGTVLSRAAGFYGATFGYTTNRTAVQKATLFALNGKFGRGVSAPGEDAAAAAMLVQGYNYAPTSAAFKQTMGEVGGAQRALNMANATAAEAIGGFQTGPMGANLYQYGISQFDKNGKPVSQAAIAKQLYSRMFHPDMQKVTKQDVQMSLQYGMAGANLRTMGFSQSQQEILSKQFLLMAQGKNPDLSKMGGEGNPRAGAQTIQASTTKLIQKAESGYIKGLEDSAKAIVKLNNALNPLAPTLGRFKGALETFMASGPGKGVATTTGILGAAAVSTVATVAGARTASSFFRVRFPGKVGKFLTSKSMLDSAKTVGTSVSEDIKGAGKIIVDKVTGAATHVGPAAGKLSFLAKAKNLLKLSPLLGFGLQQDQLIIAPGDVPDSKQSFMDRLLHGTKYVPQGGGPVGYGASFSGSSAVSSSSSGPVTQGFQMTYGFKAKDNKTWGSGAKPYHTGQDFAMPEGTPVIVKRAGVVIDETLSPDLGIYVQIDHQDGYQTIYGHLSSKRVHVGSAVKVGDVIGKSGKTGKVTGPHLHLEVRKGKNNPVNPDELYKTNILGSTDPQSFAASKSPMSEFARMAGSIVKGVVGAIKHGASNVKNAAKKVIDKITGNTSPIKSGAYKNGQMRRAESVYNFLISQGYSHNGAVGIVSNLTAESGINPGNRTGDSGTSHGIAQWHLGRKDNMIKYAQKLGLDPYSLEAQQRFLVKELNQKGYSDLKALLQAPNVSQYAATSAFTKKFERPAAKHQTQDAIRGRLGKGLSILGDIVKPGYGTVLAAKGGAPVGYGASFATKGQYSDVSLKNPQSQSIMESSVLPNLLQKMDNISSSAPKNSGATNNVTINVHVQQASEEEAMRLAKRVKQYLKDGDRVAMMGSH